MSINQYRNEYGLILDVMLSHFTEMKEVLDDDDLKYIRYFSRKFQTFLCSMGNPSETLKYPSVSDYLSEITNCFKLQKIEIPDINENISTFAKAIQDFIISYSRTIKKIEDLPTEVPEITLKREPKYFLNQISTELLEISEDLKFFTEVEKILSLGEFDTNSECPLQVYKDLCKYI